ncbi:MAG: hypothetical protein QG635_1981 [Bacteroidota bacterium]|nr:hypothetical protein [Bacteroidota bacterium]
MNSGDYMTSSEKISALLDGELGASDSNTLFFELAQNPELQDEMREMITIRSLFKAPIMQPPDKLKNNILLGTGLGLSAGSALTVATQSIFNQIIGFIQTHGIFMAISAAIASVSTALVINTVKPESSDNIGKGSPPVVRSVEKPQVFPELEQANNIQRSAMPAQYRNHIPPAYNYPSFDNNLGAVLSEAPGEASDNFRNVGLIDDMSGFMPGAYSDIMNETGLNPVHGLNDAEFIMPELRTTPKNYNKYTLQIRKFAGGSIPAGEVAPKSEPGLNNMSIMLNYKLSYKHSVGMELGQENITQQYSGLDGNHPVKYDQTYLAFWFGVDYQYTLDPVANLWDIQPYIKTFIGGTSIGPFSRNMIGLQYVYKDKLTLFTGLEYNILAYQFQNAWFNTQKFCITYGFGINF